MDCSSLQPPEFVMQSQPLEDEGRCRRGVVEDQEADVLAAAAEIRSCRGDILTVPGELVPIRGVPEPAATEDGDHRDIGGGELRGATAVVGRSVRQVMHELQVYNGRTVEFQIYSTEVFPVGRRSHVVEHEPV